MQTTRNSWNNKAAKDSKLTGKIGELKPTKPLTKVEGDQIEMNKATANQSYE